MGIEFNTQDMLDTYLFENTQLLENLQEIVLEQKDEEYFDEDSINEIFRTMHTIKGSSAIMMYDDITAVAHKLEDVFYYLRESHPQNVPHVELVEHVLTVADFITEEMDKIQNGDEADGDSKPIIAELDKFLSKIKGENGSTSGKTEKTEPKKVQDNSKQQFYIPPVVAGNSYHYYRIFIEYYPEIELANVHAYKVVYSLKALAAEMMYDPQDIVSDEGTAQKIIEDGFKILLKTSKEKEEIQKLIKPGYDIKKVDIYECTQEDYKHGFGENITEPLKIDLDSSVEDIEAKADAAEQAKDKKPKTPAPGDYVVSSKKPGKGKKLAKDKKVKADKTAFISVDIHKMDMLMDLIGELVISESVVLQNPDLKVPGLRLDNFNKAAAQMSKISTDLQNVIMSMRMVPLTNTFQKMNRIVFDVSRKLGKDINFEMIGDTTEVDKNIIEHISDPLMHLVRNSVDHGIESKEERIAAGKEPKGTITLSAKTESGKVWISVSDDGTGLDREKIMAKARKQGILDPAKPDEAYTDKEVYQFITLPGFSTNEKVTEYSGRGVGIDVVVSNIQQIGGNLEIESDPGHGSTMNLKIPLTLAIVDGIVMKVGNSNFVIEAGVVKEFVSVKKDMMIRDPDGTESVMIRGDVYPVRRISKWYHIKDAKENVEEGMMVILEVEGKHICLFVDTLIGKQEIVVKPIPPYIKKVKGLSGCTQLGDGSIALILDPGGITE